VSELSQKWEDSDEAHKENRGRGDFSTELARSARLNSVLSQQCKRAFSRH